MSTITLESIKAEHCRLAELIRTYESRFETTDFSLPKALIKLAPGERYAGLILKASGSLSHHLILLPGEAEDVTWAEAQQWASSIKGELPTRQEQALLFANLRSEFASKIYWSGQPYEEDASYVWDQGFYGGSQLSNFKGARLRARAVRRLILE